MDSNDVANTERHLECVDYFDEFCFEKYSQQTTFEMLDVGLIIYQRRRFFFLPKIHFHVDKNHNKSHMGTVSILFTFYIYELHKKVGKLQCKSNNENIISQFINE